MNYLNCFGYIYHPARLKMYSCRLPFEWWYVKAKCSHWLRIENLYRIIFRPLSTIPISHSKIRNENNWRYDIHLFITYFHLFLCCKNVSQANSVFCNENLHIVFVPFQESLQYKSSDFKRTVWWCLSFPSLATISTLNKPATHTSE